MRVRRGNRMPSLYAGRLGVSLGLVESGAMIRIGNPKRRVVNHPAHPGEVVVVDVLRFVGDLMIVEMLSPGEDHAGDPVARVVVVIGPAVILRGMPRRVVGVAEHEWRPLGGVGRFEHIPKLGGKAASAYNLEVRGPAPG